MTTHTELAARLRKEMVFYKQHGYFVDDRDIGNLLEKAAAALSTERLAGGGEPVAYLYHDANTPKDAHPWLHSTLLVLAADRRPGLRGETPLYTTPPPQAERVPLSDEQAKDAARWKQVREHWKNARFTFRKTPENTVKTITLLIDFDHATTCGANELEREFDEARAHGITPKEGT